jgi:putative methionine-R-sulfoxide reductase with GAF domain/CHASE3 domain sensor protein/HPt (histidine-containing phosphotransfer) domain-containing protein
MLQLTFNQKVGLGFAIIILLLLTSGLSSLWNLNDINGSSSLVNETAVPVVKESNDVQIQLLKLAKLSSLAFNAANQDQIDAYKTSFDTGIANFDKRYSSLAALAEHDPAMHELVKEVKENYAHYRESVNDMFTAKTEVLAARNRMLGEVDILFNLIDGVGASIDEIQYYMAPEEYQEEMELVIGFANQSLTLINNLFKTIEEIKITQDQGFVSGGMGNFTFSINDSKAWFDKGAIVFSEFDEQGLVPVANDAYSELSEYVLKTPSIADHKLRQLEQIDIAKAKLDEADASVTLAIDSLDQLLKAADEQFIQLQGEVSDSLDFGFKLSIVMLIVLILLAAQNFNSMRLAIRKKMIDLAKLNSIGRSLAGAQSQNTALEEVLQSMHEKIGVGQGSVYLTNDKNQLEVKAHFPPKSIDSGSSAAKFEMGQGILGKAAETKKIIFVPNTSKDKHFVSNDAGSERALLCVPLVDKDILVGVINLSGDVKNVSFADSDYEFVSSVARSLVTTIKSIRMREVIEEQNRNLEAKVEERTAELRQKNNDIANMMANMHQGLFTITAGGLIHPEYAAYLEQIFETDRIADRNFADLLFSNTTAGSDSVDQNITGVDAIVGEDEMMYDFNSHCLMTEMVIKMEDGREKILELDWDPIISEAGEVDKLMVTVRDVTELKALEAEAEGQKRELAIIGEILAVDAAKFKDFLSSAEGFLADCRGLIEANTTKDLDVIASLFRSMHTVKGNARTYGLSQVTDIVHEVESTYDDLRKNEDVQWNQAQLLEELSGAEDIIGKYAVVFREKLGRDNEASNGVSLDPERVSAWLEKIKTLTQADMNQNVKGVVSEAYNMLMSMEAKPLDEVISDVIQSANSLADQLGKGKPNIKIDNAGILIKSYASSTLNNIFMHVFRNAMDHGIEGIEERQQKGKPDSGTIILNVTPDESGANLAVSDDGRGIAISRIYKMAIEKGIYQESDPKPSASDIANLIFSSGFSTADAITDVSGRGVGLDAVKGFLEKEGGSIEVILDPGNEEDDFRSFTTNIRIPKSFFQEAVDFS